MYQIKAVHVISDQGASQVEYETIYDPQLLNTHPAAGGRLVQEVNQSGSLEFLLYPGNPAYTEVGAMSTYVTAFDDDEEIFYGRVISVSDPMFSGQISVQCEGALSFLMDSEIAPNPKDSKGRQNPETMTAEAFFRRCIQEHNDFVQDPRRQLQVGIIDHPQKDEEKAFSITNYTETKSAITSLLLDDFGGFIRVRADGNGNHLIDWIDDFGRENTQEIELGNNLLDQTNNISGENLFTVIRPIGKDGLELTEKTIDIYSAEDIAKFGRIVKTVNLSSATTETELRTMANKLIERVTKTLFINSEIKLIDMHFIRSDRPKIRVGDTFTNIRKLEGVSMMAATVERDFENPQNDSLNLKNAKELEGGDLNPKNDVGKGGSLSRKSSGYSAGQMFKYIKETDNRLTLATKVITINAEEQVQITGAQIRTLSYRADSMEDQINTIEGTGVIQNSDAITQVAGKFQIDANGNVKLLTGTEFTVSTLNGAQTSVVAGITKINTIEGSALWTQRDNITGVVGEFKKVKDPTTGQTRLVVVSGGGLKVERNGVEYGLYDNETLTGGIVVQKINDVGTTSKIRGDRVELTTNDGYAQLVLDHNGLVTTVGNQGSQISTLSNTVDGLNSTVTSLDGDVSTLSNTVDGLNNTVVGMDGRVSTLSNTVDGLNSTVTSLDGDVSTLSNTVDGLTSDVSDLDGNVSTLTNTVNGLNNTVTTVDGRVSTLSNTVDGLNNTVVGMDGRVSTLSNTVDGLDSTVTNVNGRVSTLSNTVDGMQSTVGDIQTTVNRHNTSIQTIEGSALWNNRDNVTGVVGEFDVVTDQATGTKRVIVKSGGGMKILRDNVEYGLYDEGKLTGGVIVQKINDVGTVTKISGERVDISASQVRVGSTGTVSEWMTSTGNDIDTLEGLVADRATIAQLNAQKARIDNITFEDAEGTHLTATIVNASTVRATDRVDTTNLNASSTTTNSILPKSGILDLGSAGIPINTLRMNGSAFKPVMTFGTVETEGDTIKIPYKNLGDSEWSYLTFEKAAPGKVSGSWSGNTFTAVASKTGSASISFNVSTAFGSASNQYFTEVILTQNGSSHSVENSSRQYALALTGSTRSGYIELHDTAGTYIRNTPRYALSEYWDTAYAAGNSAGYSSGWAAAYGKVSVPTESNTGSGVLTVKTPPSTVDGAAVSRFYTMSNAAKNYADLTTTVGQEVVTVARMTHNRYDGGWAAAYGKVSIPTASSTSSATVTVKYPTSTVDAAAGSTAYTVSADNSYAYIKVGSTTVARASHSAYSNGVTAGKNAVTITKGTWSGGIISFTKSEGTASNKSVQLTAGSASWSGNTASVAIWDGTGADASHGVNTGYTVSVDATARYNAGWTDAYGTVGISPSSNQTLGYGGSVTVYAQAKASSGATSKTNVASITITAPADRYSTGYNAGWAAAYGKVSIPTASSTSSATVTVKYPTSTVDAAAGSTAYTVSADNSYAYIKVGSTTVARASHSAYSNGVTAGKNAVTITKGTWSGGIISFTKSEGTASNKSVQLTAGSASWSGNTASVAIWDGTGADASHGVNTGYTVTVNATTRYNAGWTDAYGTVGISPSSNQTLGYGGSVTVYAQAKASSGATSKTNVASITITAPADRYSTGYNAGWAAAYGKVSIPTASSTSSATVTVKYPTSTVDAAAGSTAYTVSADNSYAYIKVGSTTVARASHSAYSNGVTAGKNAVTITKGSWSGGVISFTKSEGTASTKSVQLAAASASWDGNTASVAIWDGTGADANHGVKTGYTVTVNATARYNAGWTDAYGTVGISPSSNKTLGYGGSVTVYAQAKASSGATSKTNVASITITAPADRYSTGYNAGWAAAAGKVALPYQTATGTEATFKTPSSTVDGTASTVYQLAVNDLNTVDLKWKSQGVTVARINHNKWNEGWATARSKVAIPVAENWTTNMQISVPAANGGDQDTHYYSMTFLGFPTNSTIVTMVVDKVEGSNRIVMMAHEINIADSPLWNSGSAPAPTISIGNQQFAQSGSGSWPWGSSSVTDLTTLSTLVKNNKNQYGYFVFKVTAGSSSKWYRFTSM